MHRTILILLALLAPSVGQSGLRIVGKAKVGFHAKGPAGLKIAGKTSEIELVEDGDALLFRVPMDTVRTGIGLRDRHMREKYVQTQQFPLVELRLARSALALPEDKKRHEASAPAQFSAHGVQQEVTLRYTIQKTRKGWDINGHFDFNVEDHGITIPSYLGVTVEPGMEGHARFQDSNED